MSGFGRLGRGPEDQFTRMRRRERCRVALCVDGLCMVWSLELSDCGDYVLTCFFLVHSFLFYFLRYILSRISPNARMFSALYQHYSRCA